MERSIRVGLWLVEPDLNSISCDGQKAHVEPKAMQVLLRLADSPGETVSKDEIIRSVWPDTFVGDDALSRAIYELRKAFQDNSQQPQVIQTIAKRGYRLIAPVEKSGPAYKTTLPIQALTQVLKGRLAVLIGVAVLTLLIILGRMSYRGLISATKHPTITSLAVLPLKNLSGDATQDYLAEGMTEEIIGRLSAIHVLRVPSHTSVTRFKDSQISMPEIAQKLGVDAIVEGSVAREGTRIRVHAQLIRGATDEHLWSESYDREVREVLSLERDVAQAIAWKIEVTVSGKEEERLSAVRAIAPEVYETYLKGRYIVAKSNNKAEVEEGIRLFAEVIKREPSYAPAYVGLAEAHGRRGGPFVGSAPQVERATVVSNARKALELDPDLVEAHLVIAEALRVEWQWAESEAEFKRALDLAPNDPGAHLGLAYWLISKGHAEEAVQQARYALDLDSTKENRVEVAWIMLSARHYDESIKVLRTALADRPDDGPALWVLGFALIANGESAQAIPVLEKAVSVTNGSPNVIAPLIGAYAHTGRRKEALRLLEDLKRRHQTGYVPAAAFLNAYIGLGDVDQAFVWLERAYEEQSNSLSFIKQFPYFDPLRNDPRFADVIRRIGL